MATPCTFVSIFKADLSVAAKLLVNHLRQTIDSLAG